MIFGTKVGSTNTPEYQCSGAKVSSKNLLFRCNELESSGVGHLRTTGENGGHFLLPGGPQMTHPVIEQSPAGTFSKFGQRFPVGGFRSQICEKGGTHLIPHVNGSGDGNPLNYDNSPISREETVIQCEDLDNVRRRKVIVSQDFIYNNHCVCDSNTSTIKIYPLIVNQESDLHSRLSIPDI